MRDLKRILILMSAIVGLVLAGTAVASTASNAATLPATHRIVVRPVTAAGHPAPGYSVSAEPGDVVDCSFAQASPSAVDRNILWCSPDAAYALACWPSATPRHVLCLRDARTRHLAKLPTSGRIAHSTPYRVRAPLDLVLGNGVFCSLRDGGAGASLQGHPKWAVYYYCTRGLAVWAPMNATNWGVNRSHPTWTVLVTKANGTGRLIRRVVARAWVVGTHR